MAVVNVSDSVYVLSVHVYCKIPTLFWLVQEG